MYNYDILFVLYGVLQFYTSNKVSLILVYQKLSWRNQSSGQPNVSETTKVHIVVLSIET